MTPQHTIRKALTKDIQKMIKVEQSAVRAFSTLPLDFLFRLPENIPPPDALFYHDAISSGISLVLCSDDDLVGFICTGKIAQTDCLHIYELAVAQSFQAQGLGNKLMQSIIILAQNEGISRLTLTTFKDVPWNAPFYAKLGFITIAEHALDSRLRNILEDEINMGLPQDTRCAMELCLIK